MTKQEYRYRVYFKDRMGEEFFGRVYAASIEAAWQKATKEFDGEIIQVIPWPIELAQPAAHKLN